MSTPNLVPARSSAKRRSALTRKVASANRELWLLLAMFAIALLLDLLLANHRMVLYLYTIPTILSAYFYGRRHAVMTALASAFLVLSLSWINPGILGSRGVMQLTVDGWAEFVTWAGMLVVIAYFMGTLYERMEANMRDLRQSYEGMLLMLQHMASDNKYSQNHPHRVSLMASKIGDQLDLGTQRSDDVRRAALLHEVEKTGITREMLFQAANIHEGELKQLQTSLEEGRELPMTSGSSLRRIIPILLAFQAAVEKAAQSQGLAHIPVESKILLVACQYDMLTNAREKRISPSEAMERITQRSGIEYDAEVVDAMVKVFRKRGMDEHELATTRMAVAKS
jgi:HD-GYP domain-containing protein (c-di-GMP phosphodiesterase class II)